MPIRTYFIFFTLSLALSACASASKRRGQLEAALTLPSSSAQSRGELEGLCQANITGACALAGKFAEPERPLSIMQSQTSAKSARFVVVAPKSQSMMYFARKSDGTITRLNYERVTESGSSWVADQVEAFGLEPSGDYQLLALGADASLYDRRDFKSLKTEVHRVKMAVVSGFDDRLQVEQIKIWDELTAQKPDLIVVAGDAAYLDGVPPGQMWDRYVDIRRNLELFKSKTLIPVMAVWNGQDFGKTGGDRSFSGKTKAAETFLSFYAQRKPGEGFEPGPAVSSSWSAFGAEFFFLDNRSFRSPNGVDLPDQTHFGVDQEAWLKAKLERAKSPAILVSGDQFFGGYHPFESYEGNHPRRFKEQVEEWKKVKAPLLFVSGGRSLSEVLKVSALGYQTFEITSGPVHAASSQKAFEKNPSPQQILGAAGQMNYLMVDIMRSDRNLLRFDVKSFGLGTKLYFQKTLQVKR